MEPVDTISATCGWYTNFVIAIVVVIIINIILEKIDIDDRHFTEG